MLPIKKFIYIRKTEVCFLGRQTIKGNIIIYSIAFAVFG